MMRQNRFNPMFLRCLRLCVPALLAAFPAAALAQFGPTVVRVAPVSEKNLSGASTLVGSVRPYTRTTVASEVAGLVEKLDVEEGDHVKSGQVICQLRDTTARLAWKRAVAMREQLEAELDELEAGSRPEEIEQAKAAMEEAVAMAQKWKEEYERIEGLRRQGVASLKEYNDTLAEYSAAKQRQIQAEAALKLAVEGPRKEVVNQARYALDAAVAEEQRLKHDLDVTEIRAPFDGYIVRKATEVGQWINVGGSVVEMIDLSSVLVRVDVPEALIPNLEVGEQVPVIIDALGYRTFEGHIKHLIPQADEKARTFPVEVEVANENARLKAGMFARARVPTGDEQKRLAVPLDAVLQRGNGHVVVKIGPAPNGEGLFAYPVPVQLGVTSGTEVAVDSPMLAAGDKVAIKGHDRIYGPGPVQLFGDRQKQPAPEEGKTKENPPASTQPATASR